MKSLPQRVMEFESAAITEALAACNWSQTAAARSLGIPRTTLAGKLSQQAKLMPWDADDEPLAWAVRWDGARAVYAACWTVDEIRADVKHRDTVAVLLERGDAIRLARTMNTTIAVAAQQRAVRRAHHTAAVHAIAG